MCVSRQNLTHPPPPPHPHADSSTLKQRSTTKVESSTCGDARGDGDENDWLAQAALSSNDANRNRSNEVKDATVMNDDALPTIRVSAVRSPGGNAAGSREIAASTDWLSAAVVSSRTRSSKASSARATNTYGGAASAPARWLTSSIASGKLRNPGDDDETREDAGDRAKEIATQTDDVAITEVTRVEGTSEKPKSKLPPWAKPWTPPTPVAAADAHPTSSSSIDKDGHQAPSFDEDSANLGGHSSGGNGGQDWITATVTGEQETGAPTGCKYCSQGWYYETVKTDNFLSHPTQPQP